MENLLPPVSNIDVTSNDFREATLPYQQWEAKRTHYLPTTPSDIGHLLPPIGGTVSSRKAASRHVGTPPPAPPSPRAVKALPPQPQAAPVDRNLTGLYDPALDPSPIGVEERGTIQPVRISRIIPRSDSSSRFRQRSLGKEVSGRNGNVTTTVIIFNGYRSEVEEDPTTAEDAERREDILWMEEGEERNPWVGREDGGVDGRDSSKNHQSANARCGIAVDLFMQGFSTCIEHTTILPSETFCRSLQQHRSTRPPPPRSGIGHFSAGIDPEDLSPAIDEELREDDDGDPGLTILLSKAGDWFRCSGDFEKQQQQQQQRQRQQRQQQQRQQRHKRSTDNKNVDGQRGRIHTDATMAMGKVGAMARENNEELLQGIEFSPLRNKATQFIFQRQREDGQPLPARNAFRVQFEPGPLGMELEEDPFGRGIVLIRRVLQAGQAEQDGRLSRGFLVVAVGDCDEYPTSIPPPHSLGQNGIVPTTNDLSAETSCGETGLETIRSLEDFEKAGLRRDPDHLFTVWVLDRCTPEAIAALGDPPSPVNTPGGAPGSGSIETGPRLTSLGWSSRSLLDGHGRNELHDTENTDNGDADRNISWDALASEWVTGGVDSAAANGGDNGGGGGLQEGKGGFWDREGPDDRSSLGHGSRTFTLSSGTPADVEGARNQRVRVVTSDGKAPGWETSRVGKGLDVDLHPNFLVTREDDDRAGSRSAVITSSDEVKLVQSQAMVRGDIVPRPDGDSESTFEESSELAGLHLSRRPKEHPMNGLVDDAYRSSDDLLLSQAGNGTALSITQSREGGAWEFETGGGVFDEDDQGLVAGRRPRQGGAGSNRFDISDIEQKPVLPLGLEASAMDDIPVFIWFCNNDESSTMQVSWIDYDGQLVPRKSLEPGACYFERTFSSHPWVLQHRAAAGGNGPSTEVPGGAGEAAASGDGDCCVVRLGDSMAAARVAGSLLWNPHNATLSLIRQAKVGVSGPSTNGLSDLGKPDRKGAGVAPGKKRLCMTGVERETEATRTAEERARIRGEKMRILDEMRTWRMYPPEASGIGHFGGVALRERRAGGLGEGAPNLRVIMVGSSSSKGYWKHPVGREEVKEY